MAKRKPHRSGTHASDYAYPNDIFVFQNVNSEHEQFWGDAQIEGMKRIPYSPLTYAQDLIKVGDFLCNLSVTEREKEDELISQLLKRYYNRNVSVEDLRHLSRKQLFQQLNKLIVGKETYNENVQRLKNLWKTQEEQRKNKDIFKGKYYGEQPTIFFDILNVFKTSVREVLNGHDGVKGYLNDVIKNGTLINRQEVIDKVAARVNENLLDKFEFDKYKDSLGSRDQWSKVLDIMKEMDGYAETLFTKGSGNKILDDVENYMKTPEFNPKKYKSQIRSIINKSIDTSKSSSGNRKYTFSGSMNEFVLQAMAINNLTIKGLITEDGCEADVMVFAHEMQKIDSAIIFNFNESIQYNGAEFDRYMSDYTNGAAVHNKSEAHEKLTKYINGLTPVPNNFIIFQNTKTSNLSSSFRGFHADNGKLSDIPDIDEDFLRVAHNAAVGGIYQSKASEIIDSLKIFIMQKMAYLLFDDWEQIGQPDSGYNILHVLNLNNMIIPLSDILNVAGNAVKKLADDNKDVFSIFDVKVKLGNKEFEKAPVEHESKGNSETDRIIKQTIIGYIWNENYKAVAESSTYDVYLLKGFNDFIKDLI